MEYDFGQIEQKWQQRWEEEGVFHVSEDTSKPKFYVLDMFPYPSGAGLHVGHPLGYIASDIYARYMRHCGYNVLHPMGFDAFGLPAEQYAIQTGQHPAQTTEKNTETYRRQLRRLGLSFDWSREVCTCDPAYYKWTQWMFIQLFNSWYDVDKQKAEPIESLINHLSKYGTDGLRAAETEPLMLTAQDWTDLDDAGRQKVLLNYRLAFLSEAVVNWCPAMGTVLANDEVKDGRSERGGHPVVQKRMKQWMLRITAYAQRLLDGLEKIDWSESLKEMQRTWIGRSEGASVEFPVYDSSETIRVFTTRPDTIFGATFMVLAPEHDLVRKIVTPDQISAVEKYIEETEKRTERERMAEKKVTGVFTGAYALNPFTEKRLPVWIADYVLAGYGTGSIMAVPSGDQRDWEFATRFDLPIIPVVEGTDITKGAHEPKEGKMINSGFLNGLQIEEAISVILDEMEKRGIGQREINFRLRDAVFGRQRYWGEPFPVYYKDGAPYAMDESELPLTLPEVDKYLPTEKGDPPLARAGNWASPQGYPLETTTMPGWAGSSWYYLRYMDPHNPDAFAGRDKIDYWQNIDLYMGGAEHATGHLLYFRFWTRVMRDLGLV
ncbi:MAG: class I tRNA ligase family protein [Flavobacteriales bacterium]